MEGLEELSSSLASSGDGGGGGGEVAVGRGFPWAWPITEVTERPLTNATSTDCSGELHLKYLLDVGTLSTAAALVLLLNLLHLYKVSSFKTNPLRHLLDVAIPVDFLLVTPYRFFYCFVLSLWAADTFHDFLNAELYYRSDNGVVDAVLFFGVSPIVIILRQALLYFPVLALVDTSVPLLSHTIGCLYTLLIGVRGVYWESVVLRGCSNRGQLITRDVGISLGVVLPIFIGYVGVACWFFGRVAMEMTLVFFTRKTLINKKESDDLEVYGSQVKKLLRNNKEFRLFEAGVEVKQHWIRGLQYVLPFKFGKQVAFPLPFLAAISMAFTLLYQIIVVIVSQEMIIMGNIIDRINSLNMTVKFFTNTFPKQKLFFENLYYDVESLARTVRILFPLAHWTGWILTVFFTLYMIQNFHKHLLRAARGDLSFLLASEPLPTLPYMLSAAMRYIPFQLGHMIVGFFLYSLVVLILGAIGWGYYYLFKNHTFYGIHYWCLFMVPYMWAFVMHFLQLLLCKYLFLDRQENGNVTVVKIRFRRLYFLVTYLVLFFDVVYSMAMAILRVLGTLIFNIVMVFRLDRDLYLRGLEGWDLGHRTYMGFFYLEYTTNNAILRTFIALLTRKWVGLHSHRRSRSSKNRTVTTDTLQNINADSSDEAEMILPANTNIIEDNSVDKDSTSLLTNGVQAVFNRDPSHSRLRPQKKSIRLRNRWLVAYTLLRNPTLQVLTGSRLAQERAVVRKNDYSTDYDQHY